MAFDFSGSGQYLEHSSAVISAYPLTMACWFNADSATATGTLISIADTATNTHFWELEAAGATAGDPVRILANGGAASTAGTTSTGYTVGTWHHACAVLANDSSRTAYIDGGSAGTDTFAKTPSGVDVTTIGALHRAGVGQEFNGRIAECAIWNEALDTSEIAALARGVSPIRIRSHALVFYAPLVRGINDEVGGVVLANTGPATVAEHPRTIRRVRHVFVPPPAAGTTHATTGALTGQGSVLDGTAAHIAIHATTGVLAGQGASVVGSAARTRVHAATGALTGPGSVLDGTAAHIAIHATSGALTGPGAVITGEAARSGAVEHATTGALTGQGAVLDGTAAHIAVHATSGALVGPGATLSGTATYNALHVTSGVLTGPGAIIVGSASIPSAIQEPPTLSNTSWSGKKKRTRVIRYSDFETREAYAKAIAEAAMPIAQISMETTTDEWEELEDSFIAFELMRHLH